MVDDPDVFNNYPWENVVWDQFMETVKTFVSRASGKILSKSQNVHLEAFFLPLQV